MPGSYQNSSLLLKKPSLSQSPNKELAPKLGKQNEQVRTRNITRKTKTIWKTRKTRISDLMFPYEKLEMKLDSPLSLSFNLKFMSNQSCSEVPHLH